MGDVATITRGERFTAADYVKSDGIPCIHYGEIYTDYGTVATKTISQVKPSLRSSLRYAKPGDVIVATTSENVEDVCKAVAWIGNSPVAYHDDSFALTFSGDPVFLVSFFETSGFYAQKSSVAHGVKVMRVSSDSLANINLPTPLVVEQRLIGSYFSRLDFLITLHQRKCQYRGLYGYLSWEQRKLGRLFFESNERSSSMEILSVSVAKGIYPASESDRDTNPGASLANYKVVHKGDVVYNSMRMWQGAVGSSDYDGIVSPAYVVARPAIELDSTCFGYLLKRPEMLYKYLCDSQGNSKDTQTLKYNRFADIEVTMPANLEEQRVISACLGRVGTLITLHQ